MIKPVQRNKTLKKPMVSKKPMKKSPWIRRVASFFPPGIFSPDKAVVILALLWLAFCAFELTFPSYSWLFPAFIKYVPFQNSFWVPLILFAGMIGISRLMPKQGAGGDLSAWTARFWLFGCLCLGAYLRLYHYSTPPVSYWDDSLYTITCARHVSDLGDYQGYFVFQVGMLPACPYLSVFLWQLFPDLSTLTMQRLNGTLFDLGAIWILYLAGKEIAGRRMGVLAAALGAVSKPLIQKCFTGYTDHSIVAFGLVLSILFTLRVMKKPDVPHFLQWGVVAALGAYTTTQYIPFVPFLVFWMLGWILFQKPSLSRKQPEPMIWITASALLAYYLYYCGALPKDNFIASSIKWTGSWMPCMVLGTILIFAAYYFRKKAVEQKNEKWTGWIAAAWICTVLSFPIVAGDTAFTLVKSNLPCFTGTMGQGIAVIGWALFVLFTLRVIKKPDIPRFLQWGVAVALGAYTTTQTMLFIPILLFLVLGWILFQKPFLSRERPEPMVWITASALLVYYLYHLRVFPHENVISWFVDFAGPWMPCMVLSAILVYASYYYFRKTVVDQKSEKWMGWVSAAWICTVLSFPILTSDIVFTLVKNNLMNSGQGYLNGSFILLFLQKFIRTFDGLFWGAWDRSDMALLQDSFFSYPEAILIALGLAFCLAKPNPKRVFVLLLMMMGIVPYNAAAYPHSGYLVGCVTPFLLVGALGLDNLLTGLFRYTPSRILRGMVLVMLLGFWAWTVQGIFSRIYDQYGKNIFYKNYLIYPFVMQDLKKGYRVYFNSDAITAPAAAEVLYEGHHVYPWYNKTSNVVFLGPHESRPNIAIYAWPPADELKARIRKAYPTAQWSEVTAAPKDSEFGSELRCFIPASAFGSSTDSRLEKAPLPIEFRRLAAPCWTRQYGDPNTGLTFAMLIWEDKTVNINDPQPSDIFFATPDARYSGVIHIEHGGEYELACKTDKRTKVRVDGRKIFDIFFRNMAGHEHGDKSEKKFLHLEAGDHHVEVTCFPGINEAPEITLCPKGMPAQKRSLWASFNF